MPCHRPAHDAQTNESNFFHFEFFVELFYNVVMAGSVPTLRMYKEHNVVYFAILCVGYVTIPYFRNPFICFTTCAAPLAT